MEWGVERFPITLLSLLLQAEKTTLTSVLRVPVVLAEQLLEIAHRLDDVEFLELTRDNLAEGSSQSIEVTQDKITDASRPENGALSAFQ